jgi:monooxygenase
MNQTATEHLDVLIVGAGLSGIGAAHYLQDHCPWATYAVIEARDAIGGTWDLFRYPGIRSDSDMFTLGYSFRPWDRDESIAGGDAIRAYITDTAREAGIDTKIRFRQRVVAVDWSSAEARWTVTIQPEDGPAYQLTCGFVFSCSGYYRYDRGHEPHFEGIEEFTGTVVHPQHWPEDLDYAGKRIVVIGSGATAITLIPALAETAGLVTMLQRSPTYVASLPDKNPLANLARRVAPGARTGRAIRWCNAVLTQGSYQFSRRFPRLMRRILIQGVRRQLPKGFDVDTHFTPRYDPWDQRLCVVPNGDLFRAIREGRATVVTDHIDHFTPTGIALVSGEHLEADIVVTATGLEMLFMGGISVSVDGEDVDAPSRLTYKGMMLEGVPNMALAIGYTNASWTLKCDLTCDYVCRLLNHMRSVGADFCVPHNSDPTVTAEPLLDLTSGYIVRAADRFPKQGSRAPWRVYQSYLADRKALKRAPVDDGVMQFGRRVANVAEEPVAPASAAAS